MTCRGCKRLTRCWLILATGVAGAGVMCVELLGARLVSVVYGGSVAVWGAMISVTLLSLAAGYFGGGYLADRVPAPRMVALVVSAAAVLIVVASHARPVLAAYRSLLGWHWGALAGCASLFLLPLALLGMVGPFAIRLLHDSAARAGRTAGTICAVSTLGGVAGTLLTAFWLVPTVGVSTGFRLTALVMAVTGGIGLFIHARPCTAIVLALPLLLGFVPDAGLRAGFTGMAPDGDRICVETVRDSMHGRVTVLRKGAYRLLLIDGIVQTGMPLDRSHLEKGTGLLDGYYQELLPYMVDDPGTCRALVVGLAGALTPAILAGYGMTVDCVELDRTVEEAAKRWFGFTGAAIVADGRQYLESCDKAYDFCVLDVYSGDVLPAHLLSVEAIRAAKRVLNPRGVLAVNYVGEPSGAAFACVIGTLQHVFPEVVAIRSEAGNDVQPITILAAERAIDFNNGWLAHLSGFSGVDPVSEAIERLRVRPLPARGFVLRDDHNPIDTLRVPAAVRWREQTQVRLGLVGL
ncbi:MAG: fused MFS/spermidine synthase [Kiritimatiellae bacterium]|nr:fused MFS/spermidine synthase [Kiritimatiellia bacterium]